MSNTNTRVDNTERQSPPRHVSDGPPADPPKPPSSGSAVSEKARDGETGPVGDASVTSSGPHLADDVDGGDGLRVAPTAESIALEASLVRKLDCRLMPFAFLGLLVFWLDRTSAALAQATGSLDMDLGLLGGGGQFIVADMIFVVVCVTFAVPGNLMVRRLGGSRWLPGLIVGWGLVTIGTGFVRGFAGLCVTRALLGAAGGSFIGSVLLYIGFFYTAGELTARAGIFFSSTPVAGSVGGLLAAGLSRIRAGGYGGWPWIFFIEGAATVLLGAAAFFLLPDTPDDASFLTDDEKKVAAERGQRRWWDERRCPERRQQRQQRRPHLTDGEDQLRASSFCQAVLHPVTLLMTMGAFFSVCALSSYSIFLPIVIGTMGYIGIQSILMTIPPNLVAFLFCILVTRWSQRTDRFAVPLVLSSVLGAIGYALVLAGSFAGKPLSLSPPPGLGGPPPPGGGIGGGAAGMAPPLLLPGLQYAGTFFVAAGVNALSPLALAWVCLNANPYYVRAISLGVIMMIGSSGGVVSSFTYNQSAEPRFVVGHSMNLGFLLAAVLVGAALFGWMRVENNKRERGGRDSRLESCRWEDVNMTRDQYEVQLGWRHPGFRYKM